jgi:signal peptidase I
METSMLPSLLNIPQHTKILIYDSVGDLIIHKKIFYGQNKIEPADHPSGIYFYQILENEMSISNGKMIKI